MSDLHAIIEDAITDAQIPPTPEPTPEAVADVPVEVTPVTDAPAADPTVPATEPESDPSATSEVASPAAKALGSEEDEFAKKHGLPPQKIGERENRIPYSAVKRIVSNAEKKALEPFQKQMTEMTAKVTDYEGRLTKVAELENLMFNDHVNFLNMLADRIPGYKEIFDSIAAATKEAQPAAQSSVQPTEDMPQPNQQLADGSSVYDMDGLKALLAWHEKQVENRLTTGFNSRLEPFEKQIKYQEWQAQVAPQIQKQIEEARTWPQFKEHEDEIAQALAADRNLSLDGAYRKVVVPKLATDYNSMRTKVLQEVRQAPRSTSVTSGASPQPAASGAAGKPQSLQDVIRQAIAGKG